MPRRNKENRRPQKLTEYYPLGPKQDGGGGTAARGMSSTPLYETGKGNPQKRNAPQRSTHSPIHTPNSGSPEKARLRLDASDSSRDITPGLDSGEDTRDLPDSIDLFPTTNQPVLDTTLKDMLVSLRSSLHADMLSCVHRFGVELKETVSRVDHIEHKMGEFATTINDLVDANDNNADELDALKAKLADIEDRSRRNNFKIRGIPESVLQSDLRTYTAQLFQAILPDLTELDITMDRIHRLPKPSHLPDNIPRDVILRLHFY